MVERSSRAVGRMRAIGRRGAVLAMLAVALPALAGVAVALAADKGEVDGFGSRGVGPGQFSSSGMRDVAVDQGSGRVYVVDAAGSPSRVNVFEAGGEFVLRLGEVGEGKGEFAPSGGSFGPQGVAVAPGDASVYVSDPRQEPPFRSVPLQVGARVQKFSAVGAFELMWGWGVATGAERFEVCHAAAESCQSGIPGDGAGQLGSSRASARVVVSPVTPHHVFVADPANRRIQEFEPNGDFVRGLGWGVRDGSEAFQTCTAATGCRAGLATAGSEPGRFGSSQPVHLAIDADGILYASDSTDSNRVQRLDTTAATDAAMPLAPIGGAGMPLLAGTTDAMAVDPSSGNLLVARDPSAGETVIEELGAPGGAAPDVDFTHGVGEGYTTVDGIDVNGSSGDLYVSRSNVREVSILNIGAPPMATLGPVADVESTSATFHATLDPNGARTRWRFEYRQIGEVSSRSVPVPDGVIARGVDGDQAIGQPVDGLAPGADYEVRLAFDGWGAPGETAWQPFQTPASAPAITPLKAGPVTDTTVWLAAQVNPSNEPTTYRFEYTTAADHAANGYANATSAPDPDGALAGGIDDVVVTERIAGLQPDTDYRFRAVATNSTGTTFGPDQAFATRPSVPPPPDGRAYELVSPADKLGGVGVGPWYRGPGDTTEMGEAAERGERFAVQSAVGSVLLDGAFAYAGDWAFADRIDGQRGWVSHSPFVHPATRHQVAKGIFMKATTNDLSRIAWNTNNETIDIFPETGAWPRGDEGIRPTFLSDWGGVKPPAPSSTRWEVFGPTVADASDQVSDLRSIGSDVNLCHDAFADGGSRVICSTDLNSFNDASTLFGLAGPGDPTLRRPPDPQAPLGRAVYIADTSGELANNFPDTGPRQLVNVCADGTELPAVDVDGDQTAEQCPPPLAGDAVRLVSQLGATIQPNDVSAVVQGGSLRNVISDDGSRVFFMSPDPRAPGVPDGVNAFCEQAGDVCPTQLFVRQRDGDGAIRTRWVSRSEVGGQHAALMGTVRFEAATPDGDKVFFHTNSPLTADDPNGLVGGAPAGGVKTGAASDTSWDLYMYDFPDNPAADPGDGDLVRISAGPDGDGDCNSPLGGASTSVNNPVGALRFVSDDGRRAYFTCAASLAGTSDVALNGTITSAAGTATTTDATNLYLYDANLPRADRWRFVTRLPRGTGNSPDGCATTGVVPLSPLRIAEQLTGNVGFRAGRNCVRGTSDGAFVTLWTRGRLTADDPDAVSADIYGFDAEADEFARLTAPDADAVGGSYPCGTTGEAASVPCFGDNGFDNATAGLTVATDPLVDGDRVAFFQSRSRLVAEDEDDAYDVYQWRNGVLSLVSTGGSETDGAFYKGNDTTGRNVYFATQDALTWQDFDAVFDIYSARVDGGIAQPAEPPVCAVLGGMCQHGGSGPAPTPTRATRAPGGQNATPSAQRQRLAVRRPGLRARRRAARTGVVRVRVRVARPGAVRAVVRARMRRRGGGGVVRRVAVRRLQVREAGVRVIQLRLNQVALRRLRRGQRLGVVVAVRAKGAPPERVRFALRRAGR